MNYKKRDASFSAAVFLVLCYCFMLIASIAIPIAIIVVILHFVLKFW